MLLLSTTEYGSCDYQLSPFGKGDAALFAAGGVCQEPTPALRATPPPEGIFGGVELARSSIFFKVDPKALSHAV